MSTISQNSIKRKKKPQHSKSAKKIKNKQRSKSKRKSVPIVLNDDSDGEIEDTALNSNPIIVPIVIRSLKTDNNNKNNRHEEHILSPNELEKMLNKEDNTANEATKIHSFDYDFMSQQTQNQIARHLVATPSAQTNAKHNQARLLQTPTSIPATPLIATPAPTFIKPTAKTTNRCKLKRSNRNIKRNKKRKFKPPRLVHQSRSVPPKHNKNTTKKKPFRVPKMRPLSTTQRPTKKISKKAADFDAFLQSAFTTGDTTHNDTDTTHTTSKDRPIATSGCFKSLHQNPFLQHTMTRTPLILLQKTDQSQHQGVSSRCIKTLFYKVPLLLGWTQQTMTRTPLILLQKTDQSQHQGVSSRCIKTLFYKVPLLLGWTQQTMTRTPLILP
eukprot:495941_1